MDPGEVLEDLPVAAPVLDQGHDRGRALHLDEPLVLVGGVDERHPGRLLLAGQLDVLVHPHRDRLEVGRQARELLAEPRLPERELGWRQGQPHQLELAVVVAVGQVGGGPRLVDVGVAVEAEPVVQRGPAARVVDEERVHPALDREPGPPRRRLLRDAVLRAAGGVDVEDRRGVLVPQELHRAREEVALHRGARRAHVDVRVEGREQAQLLARLVLAVVGRAEAGEVGVLGGEARRRGLAAGVGVHARVEDEHLDGGVAGEDARHRAEADVVARAVAPDGEDGGQQLLLGRAVPGPRQRRELGVVHLRVVRVGELELGHPQRAHVGDALRGDPLEDALGQRLGVLEEAVHPRVEVVVERHRRGVDAAAARRVRDDRRRRAVAGRAALLLVEAPLQGGDGLGEPLLPRPRPRPWPAWRTAGRRGR